MFIYILHSIALYVCDFCIVESQGWEFAHRFLEQIICFCERVTDVALFYRNRERFTHDHSFVMSNSLSDFEQKSEQQKSEFPTLYQVK